MNTSDHRSSYRATAAAATAVVAVTAILCLCAAFEPVRADEPDGDLYPVRLAFLSNAFQGTTKTDVAAALPVYIDEMAREVPGVVASAVVIDTLEEATKGIAEKKIDIVICRSIDYVRNKETWNATSEYTSVRSGYSSQALLLLTRNKDVSDVRGLRGMSLALPEKNELADIYLNSLIRAAGGESVESFFGTTNREEKPANGLLKVMMGKWDVCLVEEGTFRIAAEMNQQVKKRLRVVAQSANFPVSAGAYRDKFPKDVMKEIQGFLTDRMPKTQRGKQILTLFRSDGMATIDDAAYDSIRKLLRETGEAVAQDAAPAHTLESATALAD